MFGYQNYQNYQNHGFSPYEEDHWPAGPWSWSLYSRYPVYTRPSQYSPPWLPRGSVQVYGPHHQHHHQHHHHPHHHQHHHGHYLEPEFRSNSANLPLPPSVDHQVWASRPARRTKSSAQHRGRHHYYLPPPPVPPHTPPHCYPDHQPFTPPHTSFARRFFNDRDSKTDLNKPSSHGQRGSQRQERILIEPDVHDHQQSLISQVLVSRPTSQTSHSSHQSDRSRERPVSASSSSYRVLGSLIPHNTINIHRALLDTECRHQAGDKTCTCYQCQASSKQEQREKRGRNGLNSLASDINSNFIVQGDISDGVSPISSLARSSSSKSTEAARKHLKRTGTLGRFLSQAELLKLGHFRRFLHSSGLSQLDFLYRVEQLRKSREEESHLELDEFGNPAYTPGNWREESDQEFIALSALLLCGDLKLKPDTFQAITNKHEVRERLYGLVSPATDCIVTADQVIERIANTKYGRQRNNELAGENLRWLEKVFQRTVGDHGEITLNDFKTIVQSKNPFFVERVFQIFDKDDSGSISFQEFIDAIHQFAGQTPEDKIKFLFKVYDIDGDGLIQEAELQHVMRACMEENGMSFDEEAVEELTRALYQDAVSHQQPGITYSSLKSQISKHEGLLENLTISIDRWLVPPKPKRIIQALKDAFPSIPRQFSFTYIRNNAQFIIFHILFFVINLSLIVSRLVGFRQTVNVDGSRNWAIMIARAGGQCLNFTCMFVLLPMLRLSVTKLRQKGFNYLLPLDKHTSFHRMTGHLIVVYSVIHTLAHIVNLVINLLVDPVSFLVLNNIPPPHHWALNSTQSELASESAENPAWVEWTAWDWLMTSNPGLFGLVAGMANPTGIVLLLILGVMFVCSMKWVRKSGNFEVFYWTHFLYIIFWILLIVHAPNFWKWFIGPASLFACEKLLSICKSRSEKGKSYVVTGVVLPSKVVNLVIKRPPNFNFKPGDYVYLNVPSIANFEWHPFTISSAPEQSDTLSLHIRAVGQWTRSLYEYFEQEQARLEGEQLLPASKKQDVLRSTYTAAREKARKLSASVGPGGPGVSRVATSYNLWGLTSSLAQSNLADLGRRRLVRADAVIVPMSGSLGHSPGPGPVTQAGSGQVREEESLPANAKMVARNFRYMRRKPTIMAYKPPKGTIQEEEEEEADLCSSNHFILDRIAEKDNTDTGNLYRAGSEGDSEPASSDRADIRRVNNSLQVFIDGPFGAPTNLIFHAQHAVLIGTGIGVTPFASILQSIMHRYWAARNTCPKCSYRWTNDLKSQVMNLRKVDFFWINREQRSFEWFISLLSQLEIEQAEQGGAMERFLDMHMYITSALQKTDMKAVGLQLALELLHEKSKRDLITGLKTRTIAGRPNWDRVFKKLHDNRKGKVTVFFCGPPQLGKILKQKCTDFKFEFRKEDF